MKQSQDVKPGSLERVVRRPEWKFMVIEKDGHICSRHRKLEGALIRQRQLDNHTSGTYMVKPYPKERRGVVCRLCGGTGEWMPGMTECPDCKTPNDQAH